MRRLIFITGLLISLTAYAQSINGTWKGKLVQEPGGCFPVYNIEMQMQLAGTKITGVSYHYSDTSNYAKEEFEGTFDSVKNLILINEIKVLTFHIPDHCIPCIKKYSLSYHIGGNEEQLRGDWTGMVMGNSSACPPGTLVLTRAVQTTFKPEPKLPASLTGRKNVLVKEIKVDTGTIRLDFYDNGIIDGDTISVYVNNIPVVTNRVLTAKPVTTYVRISLNKPEQEVIMVGENLGSIPPNTALMIVTAGEKRYQLYLVSDEQKNAMVRFSYEKQPAP
ncbi:MAG: hypothetical protein JST10_12680 [Bacteroidetes bacterium]|nr:hypothetical protein [Bacteroidota bacterium]MBS1633416.1 hypothetical protein [Bacteroidota bacterium]